MKFLVHNKNKNFFRLIFPWMVLALMARLILMVVTLHSDLWTISFSQYFFAFKGVTNIYEYLAKLPASSELVENYGRNFFTYPPLAYFTFGLFGLVLRPFFNADFFNHLAVNLPRVLEDSRLYGHLFLTKLPYLFFDLGVLYMLINFFDDERKKRLVAILWLFNPLVFYTSYMIGQFDVIPVFFTILSLYLAKRRKWGWAVVSLGVGGAYKMFPLFFVPFLAITQGRNMFGKLKLLLLGLSPYFLSILPFLNSVSFRQNVLFSNQTQKMLFAKINVSGAEYLSIFILLYIALLILTWYKKIELWKSFFMVMLLFFTVTHYHPQWFLWISPFLVLFITEFGQFKLLPFSLFCCWLIITLLFEPSLSISLFAPINAQLLNIVPASNLLFRYYDVFQFKSIVRSVFGGISLGLFTLLLRTNEKT